MNNFIKNLRFKMWDIKEYHKHLRVHKKVTKLMHMLEDNGYQRYSSETEDGRMKLEWTKKKD